MAFAESVKAKVVGTIEAVSDYLALVTGVFIGTMATINLAIESKPPLDSVDVGVCMFAAAVLAAGPIIRFVRLVSR